MYITCEPCPTLCWPMLQKAEIGTVVWPDYGRLLQAHWSPDAWRISYVPE